MTTAERYHFADFTRDNYSRLLRLAKNHYAFRTFTTFDANERFVLWRHDVDFSPQAALKLAAREREEGVIATYFVSLHSDFYNLLEPAVIAVMRNVIRCGHVLGLHFDPACVAGDPQQAAGQEREWLQNVFATPIDVISFHNPTVSPAATEATFAGMVNAASSYFHTDVGFCSDSNGYWRGRRLEDVLTAATDERLQVLTHPEMWQDTPMSPRERVKRCIDGRATRTFERYEALLARHGREIIG